MDKNECIIVDIECYSPEDISSPRYVETAQVKWIGIYSFSQNKYYEILIANHPENQDEVRRFINQHKTIITFNGKRFDIPILMNNGYITNEYLIQIDMWEILGDDVKNGCKNRGSLMGYDFKSNSLKNMAVAMGLTVSKGDIDYMIFKKDEYTDEEKVQIKEYLHSDIELTKQLFEKTYDFWLPFTAMVTDKNKFNWSWLKCSIASLSYKSFCGLLGMEEIYGEGKGERGDGGLVIMPTVEEARNVWYVDVVSLYPNLNSAFNLAGEVDAGHPDAWHGNDEFKVNGYYNCKTFHPKSQVISKLLKERLHLKKTDKKNPLVYTYKILLNSYYGITRNPTFANIYLKDGGNDCCLLGQQINKIMQRMLTERGATVIAGDTDSNFIKYDKPVSEDEVKSHLKQIVEYINSKVPFPQETFDIAIEHMVDYIMYVKDGDKFLKKNYLYIWSDGTGKKHLEVMGLPIIKGNATELGQLILEKYLKPRILNEITGKFAEDWILFAVDTEIKRDLSLVAREFKCQPFEKYSERGKTSIWAKISNTYLNGQGGSIKLIKNKKVGKIESNKMKFCTVEEAKDLTKEDLDLEKLMNELKPFMKSAQII